MTNISKALSQIVMRKLTFCNGSLSQLLMSCMQSPFELCKLNYTCKFVISNVYTEIEINREVATAQTKQFDLFFVLFTLYILKFSYT